MAITGKDRMSIEILEALNKGTKVKDIPMLYPVSLDQAKRLSRYNNMYHQVREHLDSKGISNFEKLGLKALSLSKIFQSEDWEGLKEILHIVDENTKRSDLPKLIIAMKDRRNRIFQLKQETEIKLQDLEQEKEKLRQTELEIKQTEQQIKKEVAFLKKYKNSTQRFFLKHLGIYEGKLILARRLDSLWQRNLKKKGILKYDEENYIWLVTDLDRLVKDYEKRVKRKYPYPTEFDYEKELKRHKNSFYTPTMYPEYRLPNVLAEGLQEKFEENIEKQREIEKQQIAIEKELKELKKTTPQSFIESVEVTNNLSAYELKKHGELQDIALKWLYKQNYVAVSEFTLPNNKRADCIGYNREGNIIIIEVKASYSDFLSDNKWETYLDYCDQFYFLHRFSLYDEDYSRMKKAGVLKKEKNSLIIDREDGTESKAKAREEIIWGINKMISRKYIYGY